MTKEPSGLGRADFEQFAKRGGFELTCTGNLFIRETDSILAFPRYLTDLEACFNVLEQFCRKTRRWQIGGKGRNEGLDSPADYWCNIYSGLRNWMQWGDTAQEAIIKAVLRVEI